MLSNRTIGSQVPGCIVINQPVSLRRAREVSRHTAPESDEHDHPDEQHRTRGDADQPLPRDATVSGVRRSVPRRRWRGRGKRAGWNGGDILESDARPQKRGRRVTEDAHERGWSRFGIIRKVKRHRYDEMGSGGAVSRGCIATVRCDPSHAARQQLVHEVGGDVRTGRGECVAQPRKKRHCCRGIGKSARKHYPWLINGRGGCAPRGAGQPVGWRSGDGDGGGV